MSSMSIEQHKQQTEDISDTNLDTLKQEVIGLYAKKWLKEHPDEAEKLIAEMSMSDVVMDKIEQKNKKAGKITGAVRKMNKLFSIFDDVTEKEVMEAVQTYVAPSDFMHRIIANNAKFDEITNIKNELDTLKNSIDDADALQQQKDTLLGTEKEENPDAADAEKPTAGVPIQDEVMTAVRGKKLVEFADVVSEPFERNEETETTLCARTARLNAANLFGIKVPQKESAKKVMEADPDDEHYVDTLKAKEDDDGTISGTDLSSIKGNVAHLFTTSKSKKYGHAALAFKNDQSGQWYVLDPYTFAQDTKPYKIADYLEKRDIIEADIYDADTAIVTDKNQLKQKQMVA